MDEKNDEQTEILREIWKQMVASNQSLGNRIDALKEQMVAMDRNLSSRIDQTNTTLNAFMKQTNENFARVQRNFERLDERLQHGTTRVDEIEARLTRVETHVGLRER